MAKEQAIYFYVPAKGITKRFLQFAIVLLLMGLQHERI